MIRQASTSGANGRGLRDVAQQTAAQLPDESGRKGEPYPGTDPQALGQMQGQPSGHPIALHDNNFREQRSTAGFAETFGEAIGKQFQAIAVMDGQHGSSCLFSWEPSRPKRASVLAPTVDGRHGAAAICGR